MPLLTTRELIDRYHNQRTALAEEAAEAGMPFSAYLDSQYDPEKDEELGADDVRLSAMEVVLEDLNMTTTCNPAAGIWPTRSKMSSATLPKNSHSKRCASTRIVASPTDHS